MKLRHLLTLSAAAGAMAVMGGAQAQITDDALAVINERAEMLNQMAADAGLSARVEMAEIYTESHEAGRMVFFEDRGNKQLAADFVPGDTRRSWNLTNGAGLDRISYNKENSPFFAPFEITIDEANDAIDAAMATWDSQKCSKKLEIFDAGEQTLPPLGLADITHWGWLSIGGSTIGVTFTLVWVDGAGNPTDIDNDGNADTALRYILYNSDFPWATDGNPAAIDTETVALHEAGHGLSQGHFGSLFQTDSNGKFHFAPRAVMNAGYTGLQRELLGTDRGGHCSNWAQWPKN